MAIKVSTSLANLIADRSSFRQAVSGGRLLIFSGIQPASADSASNGTLLCTITESGGTFTGETLPIWTITLTGASGSVNSIKMGGLELLPTSIDFTTDLATTAMLVASAITNNYTLIDYTATSNLGVIYITGPKNSGASLNSTVCVATATTLEATVSNSGLPTTPGVAAVNGLSFSYPASSGGFVLNGSWSGTAVASGTATWSRYVCDAADLGTNASTAYNRIDGSITVTGGSGDSTIDNTIITAGQVINVTSCSMGISRG